MIAFRRNLPLVLSTLAVFLIGLLVFWFTTTRIVIAPAYATFEFCQYSEIGENLATEGRFETKLLEPMALAYVNRNANDSKSPWPVLNRFPVPCFVHAIIAQCIGTDNKSMALSNGIAVSLLSAFAFVAAWQWLGKGYAVIVACLTLLNPSFFGYFVLLGTPDIWFAALFLVQLLVWVRFCQGGEVRWAILFGLASGLCYLTRFNVIVFLAVQFGLLFWTRRWQNFLIAGLTFAVIISPLLTYNVLHFNTPIVSVYSGWNLFDNVGRFAVEPWLYYELPDKSVVLVEALPALIKKFLINLFIIVPTRIWTLWHLYLILPFAIFGIFSLPKGILRSFCLWSLGLFLLQLVVFSGLRLELENRLSPFHGRYFFWYAVPAILSGLAVLKERFGPGKWLAVLIAMVVVLQLTAFGHTWKTWIQQNEVAIDEEYNFGHDPIREAIAKIVRSGSLLASNQPQIHVRYQGLTAISLPANPTQVRRINTLAKTPIDYIFISTDFSPIDLDHRWTYFVQPVARRTEWENQILSEYRYAIHPRLTRPLNYVILRRRGIAPTEFELQVQAGRTD